MDNYINMEPTSLNTMLASYAADFNVLRSLYENLMELDENDVAQPAAAEKVDISEDGLVYTFTMRDDGVWSNGDPRYRQRLRLCLAAGPEPRCGCRLCLHAVLHQERGSLPELPGLRLWTPPPGKRPIPTKSLPPETTWEDVGVKLLDEKDHRSHPGASHSLCGLPVHL